MSNLEDNLPLSVRFNDALSSIDSLEKSPHRRDSPDYKAQLKKTLDQLRSVKSSINQLGLFSINEDIEEVTTSHLRYLSVDYYIAKTMENMVLDRLNNLKTTNNLLLQFLYTLDNYGLLNKTQVNKLEGFKHSYNPTLDEIRVANPAKRREEKIENFKLERDLAQKLKILNSDELHNLDDETVRKVYLDQLALFALKSFQDLESNLMEVELLQSMPSRPIQKVEELKDEDVREKPKKFDETFTDKLETLTNPVLSKEGKVLRPFTIVSSERDKLQKKVFGTGQVLPSMTVEELVDYELKNGGMVKDELPEKEFDEDNEEDVDRLTYKNRDWDKFTDEHKRGSGNTQNLG